MLGGRGSHQRAFLPIDFTKAYDTVSHAFFEAGMQYLGKPEDFTGLFVYSLSREIQFCVDNRVAPDVAMVLDSGTQ